MHQRTNETLIIINPCKQIIARNSSSRFCVRGEQNQGTQSHADDLRNRPMSTTVSVASFCLQSVALKGRTTGSRSVVGFQVKAFLPHRFRPSILRAPGLPPPLIARPWSRGVRSSAYQSNMAETTPAAAESLVQFTKTDNRRLLHVVYRVGNLEKTIKFYTEVLGMKLLRQRDIPEDKYTNAFLGYGPEETNFVVELTYNYGKDSYDIGTGFGHFGIAVEDVQKTVDLCKSKGGKVSREPGPVKGGSSVIAFVDDPDGYKFELIQRPPTPEPFAQVCLRVGDLEKSIAFYEKAFGLNVLSKKDVPQYKYTIAKLGYGTEEQKTTVLELTYNYDVSEYTKGTGYAQIAVGTDDVYKTAEAVRAFGGKITREPGPLPGINTKITAVLDPDGWKSVFVDNVDFARELE